MLLSLVAPAVILPTILYLLSWPVPVAPTSWIAPKNLGYVDRFEQNRNLSPIKIQTLEGYTCPEDLAIDKQGLIYASVKGGDIMRITPNVKVERWATTGGRPLGLKFDSKGNLLVADAYRGILSFNPQGRMSVLVDHVNNQPLVYANAVDEGPDGTIYFSESSVKFGAEANGGVFEASLLDIMEHGGHGRLLALDTSGNTHELIDGLNFANGVSVSHDGKSVLVIETGSYRVLRYWLKGDKAGSTDVVIDNLPGFPDNLSKGYDEKYWLGLVSPRSPALDGLSNQPFLRKVVQRLPAFMRPKAQRYAHIIAFDDKGNIVQNLQDTGEEFAFTTGVLETDEYLYLSSLHESNMGYFKK